MAKGALEEIYSDSADLGMFVVSVSVLITIIVSVILILYSLLLIIPHDPHSKSVQGEVVISNCKKLNNMLTRCQVSVNYVVDNKPYIISDEIDVKDPLKVGDKITVNYDPDRVTDSLIGKTPRSTGFMLLGSGLTMLIISIITLFISRRFRLIRAGVGLSTVVGLF